MSFGFGRCIDEGSFYFFCGGHCFVLNLGLVCYHNALGKAGFLFSGSRARAEQTLEKTNDLRIFVLFLCIILPVRLSQLLVGNYSLGWDPHSLTSRTYSKKLLEQLSEAIASNLRVVASNVRLSFPENLGTKLIV